MHDETVDVMAALSGLHGGMVTVAEQTEVNQSVEVLVLGDGSWLELWTDGRSVSVVIARRDGRRWRVVGQLTGGTR